MTVLSLCMIVRNEAEHLPACLASVAGLVDEIIVVDTGSTDATREIAASHGARVIVEPWADDFSRPRNTALAAATGDWVLVLDADEELDPASHDTLRMLLTWPPMGFDLRIRNLTATRGTHNALEHYTLRLFPRGDHLRYIGLIHEQLISIDPTRPLKRLLAPNVLILHHGYHEAVIEARGKLLRNLQLLQRAIAAEPDGAYHHYNLGQTLRSMGQLAEARAAFERTIALCGGHAPAFLNNAYVHLQSLAILAQDGDTAWAWTEQGAEVCALNPDYWINRGALLVGKGRISDGIDAYTQAWELGRQGVRVAVVDQASVTWKPFVGIAQAWERAGEPEQAKLFLEICRDTYPGITV